MVVTATRTAVPALDAPAAIRLIDAAAIEQRNVLRLGDAIGDTPGLYVRGSAFGSTTPGSGLGGITLRGISNSRTLVLVDGQPLNSAYSNAVNWSSIAMDDVARVEVVPGPFSSLYGGNAMGGVIQVVSRPAERREFSARLNVGSGAGDQRGASFVYRDAPARGFSLALGAGYREHDSYIGDYVIKTPTSGAGTGSILVSGAQPTRSPAGIASYNIGDKGKRPWQQENAFVRFQFELRPEAKLAFGYNHDRFDTAYTPFTSYLKNAAGQPVAAGTVTFSDPAPLRFNVAETDYLVLQPSAEGTRRAWASYEQPVADRVTLRLTAGHEHFGTFFVAPRSGVATYSSGPGTLSDSPATRAELEAQVTASLGSRQQLVGGIAWQRNDLHRENHDLVNWRTPNSKATEYYDSTGTTRTWAAYLQDRIALTPQLALYAGARATRWETRGRATQTPTPDQPALVAFTRAYPPRSFSQFDPKASLVWRVRPAFTLRASAGTAFRTPTLLELYVPAYVVKTGPAGVRVTDADPNLKPEKMRSVELGADYALRAGTRLMLTGYQTDLRDLIYQKTVIAGTANDLNRTVNVGAARIRGLESSVRQPLGERWVLSGSVGYTDTEIQRNEISPATVGRRLGDVPLLTATAGLNWSWQRYSLDSHVRYTSHVYTRSDELNANVVNGVFGAYDAYAVVNLKAGAALTRSLRVSLAVDNLLNRTYYAFYRQPGRTWLLDFTTQF